MALTNTELEHLLYREMRARIPLSRLETTGADEGDVITLVDEVWVPAEPTGGGGGGVIGLELLHLTLTLGTVDDFVLINLDTDDIVQAQVWIPDHLTGQPYTSSQEMLSSPRRLRIGLSKGLAPGGTIDVVLIR